MKNNKSIYAPNEFCAIIDCDGDIVDIATINDDIIWSIVRSHDKREPEYAPHKPVVWDGKKWSEWQ